LIVALKDDTLKEMETKNASVSVSPSQEFKISMRADQIALILRVLREAHFSGKEAHLVAATLDAIQDPVLHQAHGGKVDD